MIRRQRGAQGAVLVRQPHAPAQDVQGRSVRRQHAPAAVQVQHADPAVVQQAGQTGAQRIGANQRLTDADELADMRQQRLDQLELSGLPAAAADGVPNRPDNAQVVQPVEAHYQSILDLAAAPALVVRWRGPQLLFGVKVGDMDHLASGPLPQAGRPFVVWVVDVEILPRQVRSRLAAVEIPGEADARVAGRPFGDHQCIARGAADLVDQSGRCEPLGVVERGLVQQRQDAVEGVEWVHDTCGRADGKRSRRRDTLCTNPGRLQYSHLVGMGREKNLWRGVGGGQDATAGGGASRSAGATASSGSSKPGTLVALRDRVVEFDRACCRLLTGKDAASCSRAGASPCSNWTDDLMLVARTPDLRCRIADLATAAGCGSSPPRPPRSRLAVRLVAERLPSVRDECRVRCRHARGRPAGAAPAARCPQGPRRA